MSDDKATPKCTRCGNTMRDARTLVMACFYDMSELNVPFKQFAIYGEHLEHTGFGEMDFGRVPLRFPTFAAPSGDSARVGRHDFFSLRVCKDCRGDWMRAIERWFNKEEVAHTATKATQDVLAERKKREAAERTAIVREIEARAKVSVWHVVDTIIVAQGQCDCEPDGPQSPGFHCGWHREVEGQLNKLKTEAARLDGQEG